MFTHLMNSHMIGCLANGSHTPQLPWLGMPSAGPTTSTYILTAYLEDRSETHPDKFLIPSSARVKEFHPDSILTYEAIVMGLTRQQALGRNAIEVGGDLPTVPASPYQSTQFKSQPSN